MKRTITSILLSAFAISAGAQTVGDITVGTFTHQNEQLLSTSGNQEFPQLIFEGANQSVIWAEGSGPVTLHQTNLNASYQGINNDVILSNSGNQNTQPLHADHVSAYDSQTGNYLTVYKNNQYQGVDRDFSLKGIITSSGNTTATPFYIEGPFQYSSDAPGGGFGTNIASNNAGTFCVAYHSSLTNSSIATVKIKMVDATSGTVSPAASSAAQNGIELTATGVTNPPSIAWNSTANVFGIVYTVGSGNNRKIKYLSVDATGAIVTAPMDLIVDEDIETQYPKIKEDGNGFALAWRDFRMFQINPFPPLTGVPAIRFARITPTGTLIDMNGSDAELYSDADESLILSNPYEVEVGLHFDLEVIVPGEAYGIVWATQNAPYEIQMTAVQVDGSDVNSTIPATISRDGMNSDAPKIGFDYPAEKVVIVYFENNGTTYENRVVTAEFEEFCETTSTIFVEECFEYTSPSGLYTWTSSNTYQDTIPNSEGCDSVITINLTITAPETGVTNTNGTLTADQSGANYQWIDCDDANAEISGATNQSFTPTESGNYAVVVSVGNCSDTTACTNVEVVGLDEEASIETLVSVFPNPASDVVNISFNGLTNVNLQLIGLNGQIVKNLKQVNSGFQMQVSDLEKGLYVLKIQAEEGTTSHRFIVQ